MAKIWVSKSSFCSSYPSLSRQRGCDRWLPVTGRGSDSELRWHCLGARLTPRVPAPLSPAGSRPKARGQVGLGASWLPSLNWWPSWGPGVSWRKGSNTWTLNFYTLHPGQTWYLVTFGSYKTLVHSHKHLLNVP